MSRYIGPRVKVMRAFMEQIPGLSRKSIERKPYPPGQHGQSRRRKASPYSLRLREKQRLRYYYGVSEPQLARVVREAQRAHATPTEAIIEMLERRLDNVVFRAGFAPTIPAARQLVGHGHVLVNGRRVDIPSFRVKEGDVVEPSERGKKMLIVADALANRTQPVPPWMSLEAPALQAQILQAPPATSILMNVNTYLVIEYYAQRS
jgi:small subunit ribosomal protein S4